MTRHPGIGTWVASLAFIGLAMVWGCDDGGKKAPADGGTDADTDTDTDTDDAGPDGGNEECDRGDPEDFPTDCLEDCEDACTRLDECGGADAPGCPMTPEDCATYCAIAFEGGHSWGEVSGHFRCCTSQEDCADVAGCGGWLDHPDAEEPCELYCECQESFWAMGALGSTQVPPPGYAWAPSVVAIRPGSQTVDYEERYGAAVMTRGGVVFLGVAAGPLREMIAYRLKKHEATLPTFVDGAGRVAAADGDIVIEAADPAAILAARSLVAGRGFASVRDLGWSKGKLHVAGGGDPWVALDVLWELNSIPGVRAELDMVRIYERRYAPDDPLFADQWHLLNEGQCDPDVGGGAQLAIPGVDGRVSEAWDVTGGDPATIIAVLDDGVNMDHQDLAPNLVAEPYNFPENWQDYMGEPYSNDVIASHGTCCAGVAAARGDNGIGVSGVCPQCSLLPGLVWDQTLYPEDPEQALPFGASLMMSDEGCAGFFTDLVDLGASVISNSWGMGGEDPQFEGSVGSYPPLPSILNEAFNYAETDGRGGLGTLIVFAAGNNNMNAGDDPYLSHPNVVGAAAIDDQGLKSYYSSYGDGVDVAAPSNGGLLGITTVRQSADAASDPQYEYLFGGTSSATPFVAGVLGLVLSADPTLTAAQARQILTDSATEIDPVWGDWSGGVSPFYGHGIVNAWRAVEMATGACTDPAACFPPSDECLTGCDGTACAACRTDNDCADGWACQPLPALGGAVCVEAVGSDTCGSDTAYVNGYCVPSRAACGLCGDEELCNGRDDDCDGTVDEDLTGCAEASPPEHPFRCLQDGAGCQDGQACAATICEDDLCTDVSECETGEECVNVKTRYGQIEPYIGVCRTIPVHASCFDRCLVRDSSAVDEELQAFADCIYGMETCNQASLSECRDLLPDGN